jgi:Rrf2 family protein
MIFSKSFAYALRGILYISTTKDGNNKIRVEDISKDTGIPRHFLGKIMNKMVKAGIVSSIKGPIGGFYISNKTLDVQLLQLYYLFDGSQLFDGCALRLKSCSEDNACPMHHKVEETKKNIKLLLTDTTIRELLNEGKPELTRSLAVV